MRKAPMSFLTKSVSVALAIVASGPLALAHHSSAMFDKSREISLTGVVTDFQWTNPHSWIEIDAKSADGAVIHHSIELGPVRSMTRSGWKSGSLKAGDKVTLIVHPLKNGTPGGLLVRATLPDGSVLEYIPI